MTLFVRFLQHLLLTVADAVFLLPAMLAAAAGRLVPKRVDVGLGPEPLINACYHKQALEGVGYSAETFVTGVYYITDAFDVRADRWLPGPLKSLRGYVLFLRAVFRYRCLYLYFSGGPLGYTGFLWRLEPLLYHLAGVRTVLMAYGSDVQDLRRCPTPAFKDAMSRDYPAHRFRTRRLAAKVDLWTRRADHIVAGADWVDYLHHWDTLMVSHFCVDTEALRPEEAGPSAGEGPLRILHAPNHRHIKGTRHFEEAVRRLRDEGLDVELAVLERVPNVELRRAIAEADLVADQLVIGWYAMFAVEAMAMGKPVLCFVREDLRRLYEETGLLEPDELPIVHVTPATVTGVIRTLVRDRARLGEIGRSSRRFVVAHHSLEAVGGVFDRINRTLGLQPRRG